MEYMTPICQKNGAELHLPVSNPFKKNGYSHPKGNKKLSFCKKKGLNIKPIKLIAIFIKNNETYHY